ncbi:MAG: LPS export ABC transporter permease LptF [Deltaproteobacteria bacterium]|nr:LPS export ABC transporter permease LptF [Deltaproteobacteria bacterium]MBW2662883.1 LPS export ABC transporter permease LptF [Deltaproteobacteria bacterium]
MKINSIINRYLFKEMVPPFVINLLFFTFVFLLTRILDITNMIVNYRISLFAVLLMLLYSIPHFLEFVIPMSIMMSVLLTFLRMSGDNEIVALKAGGISIYGLLPSVFLFCLIGCFLTGLMTVYGKPWGRMSLKTLTYEVITSNIDIGLKERTFNDKFKDVTLYMNKIDLKNNLLIDVFIEDQRAKDIVSTVVAPRGKLLSEPGNLVFHLQLYDGSINQVNLKGRSVHSIKFDTYDISLDLKKAVFMAKSRQKDEKEMTLFELFHYLKAAAAKDSQYYSALIEFHKKFAIPFACFALGFLAVPLGVQTEATRRSYGLGLGLIFFLAYYLLLSAGWVFGETGKYPPVIGMWLPNIVIGGIGLYLLNRMAKERPIEIDTILYFLKHKIKK